MRTNKNGVNKDQKTGTTGDSIVFTVLPII